jgi:hypothetical protein
MYRKQQQQDQSDNENDSHQFQLLARSTSGKISSETSKIRHHHQLKNESTGFTITNTCSVADAWQTKDSQQTSYSDVDFNSVITKTTNSINNTNNKENMSSGGSNFKQNKVSKTAEASLLLSSYGRGLIVREKTNKRLSLNIDQFNLSLNQKQQQQIVNNIHNTNLESHSEQETEVELLLVVNEDTAAAKLPKLNENDVAIDCCFESDDTPLPDTVTSGSSEEICYDGGDRVGTQKQPPIVTSFQPSSLLQKSQYFRSFRSASRRFFGSGNNLKRAAIANATAAQHTSQFVNDDEVSSSLASRRVFKENDCAIRSKLGGDSSGKVKSSNFPLFIFFR